MARKLHVKKMSKAESLKYFNRFAELRYARKHDNKHSHWPVYMQHRWESNKPTLSLAEIRERMNRSPFENPKSIQ